MPRSRSRVAGRTDSADTFRGQIIALLADGKPRDAQTIVDAESAVGLSWIIWASVPRQASALVAGYPY